MRVRQDGDSRGVGEPPRLSVQVLRLAPPRMFTACFGFMFIYLV